MAYWNPFGWSEDTRRSIQSVVRPVMQVASMAASMGAFSGGGGAAAGKGSGSAGGAAAAAGTDMSGALPFEAGMDMDLGIGSFDTFGSNVLNPAGTAQFTGAPTGSFDFPLNAQGFTGNTPGVMPATPTMSVSDTINTTDKYIPYQPENPGDPLLDIGVKNPNYIDPNNTAVDSLAVEPFPQQAEQIEAPSLDSIVDRSNEANRILAEGGDPNQVFKQKTTPVKDQAEVGEHVGYNQPTTTTKQVVNEGAAESATETPVKPEVKPKGPGPGGEEISSWNDVLDKGLNWKNIEKFLKSKEGLQWLLRDEKGLAGIGRKLSAAADAGTSSFTVLTPEERKKIRKRLEKKREEREKEREERKNE